MPFPNTVVIRAWRRQGGHCAYCGKLLTWANYGQGTRGAWHPHHRKPESYGGSNMLGNCAILCVNEPENCHLKIGHGGSYMSYHPVPDYELPYLYYGKRVRKRRTARRWPRSTIPGLYQIRGI